MTSNNEHLPRLFDDHGALIDVDASHMDASTLARLSAIRHAFQANGHAQAELDAATAAVTTALESIKAAETFHNARWPKQSQHDLWKENFGGGPRNRMTRGY